MWFVFKDRHKAQLSEFSFLLEWSALTDAQKFDYLTKNACHELSFFVKTRDPEFFDTHMKPILANKKKVYIKPLILRQIHSGSVQEVEEQNR